MSHINQQTTTDERDVSGNGVNAKKHSQSQGHRTLSTPGQAMVLANFAASYEKRVAAIRELDPELDHAEIERTEKIIAHVQGVARSCLTTGKLPDWSKTLSKDIKQFFRLRQLLSQPNAQTITIRLGHDVAETALSAPRGPADHLAGVITRTLKGCGVNTELVFSLEFTHRASRENHPLHIHGALCIPDDQLDVVTEALKRALGAEYRARGNNIAVKLERPRSAGFWAAYCIKESSVTSLMLSDRGFRKNMTSYSSRTQTQNAKAFYERIGEWL